ncbi:MULTISPECIES: DUF5803 family protein [Halobacterium]|uniref:Lipoprotein n=4 Tax=Halobacterium salinarum TaxID=2242 RepID=Q9HRC5_HALSA|nr:MULTISPECIES: DUF5803 family protein [Halobacterium]AAG19233.1 hypothetical protein VNG_0759H [Halobacterium salinarum NRC-1]MBB6090077.1 hypothetical protein [Halobacterium salinarum]MCF2165342.1 hypothetical protein [Halobacterium salinarum]MCF2168842.1 hypothetical protein [Halobacterium salinarum]MCF2239153.1 hypothetical protein [Halobacterium salinarum]
MRALWVALAVAALAVTAGCAGFGGPQSAATPSDEQLAQNATYEWSHTAPVAVNMSRDTYTVVASVTDRQNVTIGRPAGRGDAAPTDISAVAFRHPNGTVVGSDAINVSTTDSALVATFPATNGTFAYTAPADGSQTVIPVVVNGSHSVTLPRGMRASLPIISSVQPGGYDRRIDDDRVRLAWDSVPADRIRISYYSQRNAMLFAGLAVLLGLVGAGGVIYYRLQIRQLESERVASEVDLEK